MTQTILGFGPYRNCPNCDSHKVYGNGTDATELACPDCGMQYDPTCFDEATAEPDSQPYCLFCGEDNDGPHSACAAEIDTITAPAEGATTGDYVWFYERALELGYHMAVMPDDK